MYLFIPPDLQTITNCKQGDRAALALSQKRGRAGQSRSVAAQFPQRLSARCPLLSALQKEHDTSAE